MRLARVMIDLGYVVDLDVEDMEWHARRCLYEDIMGSVKYDDLDQWIQTVEDPTLKEEDIPEFLIEATED